MEDLASSDMRTDLGDVGVPGLWHRACGGRGSIVVLERGKKRCVVALSVVGQRNVERRPRVDPRGGYRTCSGDGEAGNDFGSCGGIRTILFSKRGGRQ